MRQVGRAANQSLGRLVDDSLGHFVCLSGSHSWLFDKERSLVLLKPFKNTAGEIGGYGLEKGVSMLRICQSVLPSHPLDSPALPCPTPGRLDRLWYDERGSAPPEPDPRGVDFCLT